MNFIIYKTINLVNGKFYVGQHKIDINKKDNYLGSGNLIKLAIKKYGRDNFKRIVLENCSDKNVSDREKYWIDELDATNLNIAYNLDSHVRYKWKEFDKERREQLSSNLKGKIAIYNKDTDKLKYVEKEDALLEGFIVSGRPKSERTKRSISKAKMGVPNSKIKGVPKPKEMREKVRIANLGLKHSEERKRKNSETNKLYMWVYNPTTLEKLRIKKTTQIPKDFIRGMGSCLKTQGVPKSKEHNKKNSDAQKLKIRIYNEILDIEKYINKTEGIPNGYRLGRRPYKKNRIKR